MSKNFTQTRLTVPSTATLMPSTVELTTVQNEESTFDFSTLTLTIVRHLFSGKGYVHQEDWEQYVNFSAIRDRCFFADPSLFMDSQQPNDRIECTVQEADACLSHFLHDQNVYYFYVYIGFALFFVTLALLFNVVAIVAVTRCREKYPRHHVFISLSLSDLLLTTALLLKRCGDQEEILGDDTRQLLKNAAVPFHIGYLMSAIGLLCLSLDNVLAIAAPYFYESLSRPLSTRILIGCLWSAAMTFSIVIRILELHTSFVVQVAVCIGMLILLVGILTSYIFVCAQSHVHHRRLAVMMMDDRRAVDVRAQLRGFLTTGLLVFWCLLCWSPLVGYWLTDIDTLSTAHRFFTRYLVAAVLVLHLNSVVDPVIYCLRLRDIRKSLFQLLGINKRARQQSTFRSVQYSQYSSNRNGSARKSSAATTIHNDSCRRSYCAEGKLGNGQQLLKDGTDEKLLLKGISDKKSLPPYEKQAANGHTNNNAPSRFTKGRATRAASAPTATVFASNELSVNELRTDLNGEAKQRIFQNDSSAFTSLCDEKIEEENGLEIAVTKDETPAANNDVDNNAKLGTTNINEPRIEKENDTSIKVEVVTDFSYD